MAKCKQCEKDVSFWTRNVFGDNVCHECQQKTATALPPPQAAQSKTDIQPLRGSTIAVWLNLLAVIDFLAAVLGVLLFFGGNSNESQFGWMLVVAGISGGLVLLAIAKIINCLHESAYRLRCIQRLLEK